MFLNRSCWPDVRGPASNGRSGRSTFPCGAAGETAGRLTRPVLLGRIGSHRSRQPNTQCLSRFSSNCRRANMDGPRLHSLSARKGFLISAEGNGSKRSGDRLARWDVTRVSVRQTQRVVASFRKPGDYSLAVARSGFEFTRMWRFANRASSHQRDF